MDEKAHIPAGYSYVRYQDMRINRASTTPERPRRTRPPSAQPRHAQKRSPLGKWRLARPLQVPRGPARTWGLAQWAFGDKLLHLNGNDANLVTFWARFPFILVSLLLGFFIFRWTKELAGTVAGLFAALLYFFDPNIIGHSHYVTTDIGIAAFMFFAFYFFVRFLKDPSNKNILWSVSSSASLNWPNSPPSSSFQFLECLPCCMDLHSPSMLSQAPGKLD